MSLNKNSNAYIICYIILLVVIVGSALAFTSSSLRPRQQANIDADKMKQILSSVHIVPEKSEIIKDFNRFIVAQYVVNSAGDVETDADAFDIDVAAQVKLPDTERRLPVYEARMADGSLKYILPLYGAGLWGPIWGYVALNEDASTVYGAFFSHQGETPGLGAEIEKPAFRDQFEGKVLFHDNEFLPVQVVKKGQKPTRKGDYVDGVSGGTITSKGVGDMLDNCLLPYADFLSKLRNNSSQN